MVAMTYDCIATIQCRQCLLDYLITFHKTDYDEWLAGDSYIQDVMPYLTAGERELLISGICGDCFDRMFPVDN